MQIDPRKQFSKKLASRAEWFWFVYLLLLLALLAYRPEIGIIVVWLALVVTFVMLVSVLAYTKNSMYEKGLYAARDLAKIKFRWKYNNTECSSNVDESEDESKDNSEDDSDDESEDEPPEEGESNG